MVLLGLLALLTVGEVEAAGEDSVLSAGGYISVYQSAAFTDDLDSLLAGNLIMGRLNLDASWPWLSATLETRSRIVYGEPAGIPGVADALEFDLGAADLSWNIVEEAGLIWNIAFDRAYLESDSDLWRARVGRQRINWGMAQAWNPNDLFNAFDFLDLRYVERPGSDAVRFQYYPAFARGSALEIDMAAALRENENTVSAVRVGWNQWETDFQALTGWQLGDLAFGGGWAANVKEAGFKGEATWFQSVTDTGSSVFVATAILDYSFSNRLYASTSILFNSSGTGNFGLLGGEIIRQEAQSKSKNPFPSKWAYLVQARKTYNVLWTGSLALLYAPDADAALAMPVLTYSIADDWDFEGFLISMVGHGKQAEAQDLGVRSIFQFLSIRFRWSI